MSTRVPDSDGSGEPTLPVPAEQAWFWTEGWQQREGEVEDHLAHDQIAAHNSTAAFLDHLDRLDSSAGDQT